MGARALVAEIRRKLRGSPMTKGRAQLLAASFSVTGALLCNCNATVLSCADDAAAAAAAAKVNRLNIIWPIY